MPGVEGQLNYGPLPQGGGSPSVSVDAEKLLDSLEMAAMIAGAARKQQTNVSKSDAEHAPMGELIRMRAYRVHVIKSCYWA